jgi:hypothetical protein
VNLEWEQVVVDSTDPAGLGRWWADALGWVIVNDSPEEFEIRPSADRLPGLIFVKCQNPNDPRIGFTWTSGHSTSRQKSSAFSARGRAGPTLDRVRRRGWSWQTLRATNSACYQRGEAESGTPHPFGPWLLPVTAGWLLSPAQLFRRTHPLLPPSACALTRAALVAQMAVA